MSEISGRLGGERDVDDAGVAGQLLPDGEGARFLRQHLCAGVSVISTVAGAAFRGTTVTSCSYVSGEPLLLLAAIDTNNLMDGWLEDSGVFALSVLPWTEQFVADQFAGLAPRASSTFEGIEHFFAETGSPIFSRSIAWCDCRVVDAIETGDHRCFVGEVVALGRGSGDESDPLLNYLKRYRRLR